MAAMWNDQRPPLLDPLFVEYLSGILLRKYQISDLREEVDEEGD